MAQRKRTSLTGSQIASRVFMLIIGIIIATWLYFINLDTWDIPTYITFAGYDITKYSLVIGLIFVGVLAGVFIKYGMRGGRLQLS